jgi:hypothetical protein
MLPPLAKDERPPDHARPFAHRLPAKLPQGAEGEVVQREFGIQPLVNSHYCAR